MARTPGNCPVASGLHGQLPPAARLTRIYKGLCDVHRGRARLDLDAVEIPGDCRLPIDSVGMEIGGVGDARGDHLTGLSCNHFIRDFARLDLTSNVVRRRLRAPTCGTALPNTRHYAE
jgi:hypothetical protein